MAEVCVQFAGVIVALVESTLEVSVLVEDDLEKGIQTNFYKNITFKAVKGLLYKLCCATLNMWR